MKEELFLLNILKLQKSIKDNDLEQLYAVINDFNAAELTLTQTNTIRNLIRNSDCSYDTRVDIINGLDFIVNKEAILVFAELKEKNYGINDKARIKEILEKDMTFDNDTDRFETYYMLVNIVVLLQDNELLEVAINRIQNTYNIQ